MMWKRSLLSAKTPTARCSCPTITSFRRDGWLRNYLITLVRQHHQLLGIARRKRFRLPPRDEHSRPQALAITRSQRHYLGLPPSSINESGLRLRSIVGDRQFDTAKSQQFPSRRRRRPCFFFSMSHNIPANPGPARSRRTCLRRAECNLVCSRISIIGPLWGSGG